MKTMTVQIKNVYGNEMIYPVCEIAKKFALLTGKKTLSMNDIRTIKELGYSVEVAQVSL
jgi:hypothetical protein